MNLSNELTQEDFQNYLKHLESLGAIIDDWSYSHTNREWTVSYRIKPAPTPDWIQINFDL